MQVGGVILAAGRGELTPGVPKVLERIGGQMIIEPLIRAVRLAEASPIIVVVNESSGKAIKQALEASGHHDLIYAVQHGRYGPAHAALQAVPELKQRRVDHFFLGFGDMPFVRPESVENIIKAHTGSKAQLTHGYWRYESDHALASLMRDYAYLNPKNPEEVIMYQGDPPHGAMVPSSTYVFSTAWYEQSFDNLLAYSKGDGYEPEYHLPPLITLAQKTGTVMACPVASSPLEITGINNKNELLRALEIDFGSVIWDEGKC